VHFRSDTQTGSLRMTFVCRVTASSPDLGPHGRQWRSPKQSTRPVFRWLCCIRIEVGYEQIFERFTVFVKKVTLVTHGDAIFYKYMRAIGEKVTIAMCCHHASPVTVKLYFSTTWV